jgi:hypothetical protein
LSASSAIATNSLRTATAAVCPVDGIDYKLCSFLTTRGSKTCFSIQVSAEITFHFSLPVCDEKPSVSCLPDLVPSWAGGSFAFVKNGAVTAQGFFDPGYKTYDYDVPSLVFESTGAVVPYVYIMCSSQGNHILDCNGVDCRDGDFAITTELPYFCSAMKN